MLFLQITAGCLKLLAGMKCQAMNMNQHIHLVAARTAEDAIETDTIVDNFPGDEMVDAIKA